MKWLQAVVQLAAQDSWNEFTPGAVLELPNINPGDNPWWPFDPNKPDNANLTNPEVLKTGMSYPDQFTEGLHPMVQVMQDAVADGVQKDLEDALFSGGPVPYGPEYTGLMSGVVSVGPAKVVMEDYVPVKVFDGLSNVVQDMAMDIFNLQAEVKGIQEHLATPAPMTPQNAFGIANDAFDVVQKLKAMGAGFEQVETLHHTGGLPKLSVTMSFNPKSKGVVGALVNAMTGAP